MDCGRHNGDFDHTVAQVLSSNTYRDLSTVMLMVTRGMIPSRVMLSWFGLIWPPNQKRTMIVVERDEVGRAYNDGIRQILTSCPGYKYLLTLEEDNIVPHSALVRLYESVEQYDIIGGLYWMKQEQPIPVAFGDPRAREFHLRPIVPQINAVQPVCMVGLGCTLWKLDVFRRIPEPWFETQCQLAENGKPGVLTTQDVPFFTKAYHAGIKVAVDTRVRVGHLDVEKGIVW